MAKTNKVMDGMELLKKGMRGLKKIKARYNAAYEKGMQRPSVKKAKANMTSGAKNNWNF